MYYITIQPAVAGFSPAITAGAAAPVTTDGATDGQPPTNRFKGRERLPLRLSGRLDDAAYFE